MTRANIYLGDIFFAQVASDAYPGGELWKLMESLDGSTQREFDGNVDALLREWNAERLASEGATPVGNWSYEFTWMPTVQPESYRDWENWKGVVMVREPLEWGFAGYVQVPGPWQPIGEFHTQWKLSKPMDLETAGRNMDSNGWLTAVVTASLTEDIMGVEEDALLYILADKLTDFAHDIPDLGFKVVGHEYPDTVLLEVSANLREFFNTFPPPLDE